MTRRTRKIRWLVGALAAAAVLAPAAMAKVSLVDGLAVPRATPALSEHSLQFGRPATDGVALGQIADGLRYQALAGVYQRQIDTTSLRGLRADGLRYQAIAQTYSHPQASSSSSGFDWGSAGIGAGIAAFVAAMLALGGTVLVNRRRVLHA